MPRRRRLALGAALAALGLIGVAGGGVWLASFRYLAPGPLPVSQATVIPRGTLTQVGEALQTAGVVASPFEFRIAATLTRAAGPLHAGELVFPAAASLSDTLLVLREGRVAQHHVTIPEGLTAAQVALLLDRTSALTGDPVVPQEGGVLPETYDFARGASRVSVVQRAGAAMQRALARAWAARDPAVPLDDPQQMLTLASIVERETARPEERAHIAGVFLNRLRRRMRLQSDPTVIYAVTGGIGVSNHPISHADLELPNPYNTYTSPALPPGPIAGPGLASLQAVAHPLPTEDLYFVADGRGGHVFAATLEEHQRNVAAWRALEAKPTIR